MNPWFLSAAVRWYADHPAERPGIGTRPGYERLLEVLRIKDFPGPMPAPEPDPPRQLVIATWLTRVGVGVAMVSAVVDLLLVSVFESVLVRRGPLGPQNADGVGAYARALTVVWLLAVALFGMAALALLYGVRRRNEYARVGLMVLAGLAVLSVLPCGSPGLFLAGAWPPAVADPWTEVVYFGWLALKAIAAGSAAAVVVLLLKPSVRRYCDPSRPVIA